MITKHALPLIAITLIVMLIAPGYVMAADESPTSTIRLNIDSKHAGQYDEVVNLAEESAITNPATWTPSPQGIWFGASTKESLFRFNTVATEANSFKVASMVQWNKTQIMNGASEWIVRSPISAAGVISQTLSIYQLDSRDWSLNSALGDYVSITGNYTVVAILDIDMNDTSITTGSDAWTVEDRTYVQVRCPVYSGYYYVLGWAAKYAKDSSFTMYMTGQDVVNDNITSTKLGFYTRPAPDRPLTELRTLAVDPGISFDMLTGLGNGVYASSVYMDAGSTLNFTISTSLYPQAYHTLMIPFGTQDNTLKASVDVRYKDAGGNFHTLWSNASREWTGYILACSGSTISGGNLGPFYITITVTEAERVNWIFTDSPTSSAVSYLYNQATLRYGGAEHTVWSRPWNSYQLSVGHVYAPSMNPADIPMNIQPQVNQQGNYYGTIIGAILIIIGGVAIATGIGVPIGLMLGGAGAVMIVADIKSGGNFIGSGTLPGWISNPLDMIWDTLMTIGEWLWSIGEALYDAITWIVDAITDYLPVLLGLLIIAVALGLFFIPIYAQLKLWGIIWTLSEGKVQEAAAQAADLAAQGQSAVGKIKGVI